MPRPTSPLHPMDLTVSWPQQEGRSTALSERTSRTSSPSLKDLAQTECCPPLESAVPVWTLPKQKKMRETATTALRCTRRPTLCSAACTTAANPVRKEHGMKFGLAKFKRPRLCHMGKAFTTWPWACPWPTQLSHMWAGWNCGAQASINRRSKLHLPWTLQDSLMAFMPTCMKSSLWTTARATVSCMWRRTAASTGP